MENRSRVYSRAKAIAHQSAPPAIPKRRRTATPAAGGKSSPPSSPRNETDATEDDPNVDDQQIQSSLDNDADQSSDCSLPVLLSDLMLDCPICFDPLSTPVFQKPKEALKSSGSLHQWRSFG